MREGHCVPSSGLHSSMFLQNNLVFMHPYRCEQLCRALATAITARVGAVDVCVSPAVGGIIAGHETACHLGAPSTYVERQCGILKFRCAFGIEPGARVAVRGGHLLHWNIFARMRRGRPSGPRHGGLRGLQSSTVRRVARTLERPLSRRRRSIFPPGPPTRCRRSWRRSPKTPPGVGGCTDERIAAGREYRSCRDDP